MPRVAGPALVILGAATALAAGTVEKIKDAGPDTNRLVMVIVGDGYQALEEDKFRTDTQQIVDGMLAEPPYREYASYINVYTVFVPSNESGADKPAACYSPPVSVDTAFDGRYCTSNTQRLVTVNSSKVFDEVNQSVPQWDVIGVVVNDPEYGGSGGSLLVFSTHAAAIELFLHEAGHTFSRLADEYETPFVPQKIDPEPNVELDFVFDDIKWNVWIDPSTPLPTPESIDTIGAYEGARYHSEGIFRPVINCKMRSLNRPFGAVCKEAHVQKIYQFVDPIDGELPSEGELPFAPCSEFTFEVIPMVPDPQTLVAEWRLDGSMVPAAGFVLTLNGADLPNARHDLTVTVSDETPLVRREYWDDMESVRSWSLVRSSPQNDQDGDGIHDVCDDDIDGDGVDNDADCAPRDPDSFDVPPEVSELRVNKTAQEVASLDWTDVLSPPGGTPPDPFYLIVSGTLADLHADAGFNAACKIQGDLNSSLDDGRPGPGPGDGFYYLVQAVNECGVGGAGSSGGVPDARSGLDATLLPTCP